MEVGSTTTALEEKQQPGSGDSKDGAGKGLTPPAGPDALLTWKHDLRSDDAAAALVGERCRPDDCYCQRYRNAMMRDMLVAG